LPRFLEKYSKWIVIIVLFISLFGVIGNLSAASITLWWTAPGDDNFVGRATEYDIRYATFEINDGNWGTAVQVVNEPVPDTAGSVDSVVIDGLFSNTTYFFAMKTADELNNWSALSNIASYTTLILEDVEESEERQLPVAVSLEQNYPNPFNPTTKIVYELPRRMDVRLEIYNLLGQKIKTPVSENQSAGRYSEIWDGTDSENNMVVSGVYFYRIVAGDYSVSKKMLLLK
jgi:hypothetical protein